MKPPVKRYAIAISLLVHAALLSVLCFWYLPDVNTDSQPVQHVDAANQRLENRQHEAPTPAIAPPLQPEVSEAEIRSSVASQIKAAEAISDENKLTELEKNLRRLQAVSSEPSVQQLSATIAQSLGLDADQYKTASPSVAGELDTNTAQLSDVVRVADHQGRWHYETVMVDAQGHQMHVPIDAAAGEKLYETFALMRRYPLAKGVYQSVVMPMMQKMLDDPGRQPAVVQQIEESPIVISPDDIPATAIPPATE